MDDDERDYAEEAFNQALLDDPDPEPAVVAQIHGVHAVIPAPGDSFGLQTECQAPGCGLRAYWRIGTATWEHAPYPEPAVRASFRESAWLKRGVRFRAFPTRSVRQADGSYVVPTYRVTAIRRRPGSISIYYCDDADGRGKWLTTLTRLQENGLEILP